MVTDVGGLGDRSFNDSAYAGMQRAARDFRGFIEVLQSRSAADYQPNLTALSNGRYDAIFAIGFLMNEDLAAVAGLHPKQRYAIIDAVVDRPNVTSVTFKEQDGSFLAGALAAMVSRTHDIAFLGGMDIPLLRKFEAGFIAGAREIDPRTVVRVKYVGSFDDVAAGKELANILYDSGSDIIFAAAGRAGLGAMDAVKDRSGDYVIGVDSNQDALVPGKVLTSMIKRVDVAVYRVAVAARRHAPLGGHLVLGLRDDGIALSDFRYTRAVVRPQMRKRLEAIRAAIVDSRIVVPFTREGLATFTPTPL